MSVVSHFFNTLFSWPNGIVVGNLLASLIWAVPALWHLHKKLDRIHEHLKRQQHDSHD